MAYHMMESINRVSKVSYGYAVVDDVISKRLGDIMPSYFLAETCKYLYLIFDPQNIVNTGNYIFTTEGHMLPVNRQLQSRFQQWFRDEQLAPREFNPVAYTCTTPQPVSKDWNSFSTSFEKIITHCTVESDKKVSKFLEELF
jgi:hypothetical protein